VTVLLAGIGALAAACVQSTTGLGFALLLTPILFALLPPVGAILTVTALGLELNLLMLVGERRRPYVAWGEAVPLLAAAIPGTACGVLALRLLPKPVLQIAVGSALIAAALLRLRLGRASAGAAGTGRARLAVGFTTGVLTTSTGVSGPPLALWFSRQGMTPSRRCCTARTWISRCLLPASAVFSRDTRSAAAHSCASRHAASSRFCIW
jgi:uncharacterized protein